MSHQPGPVASPNPDRRTEPNPDRRTEPNPDRRTEPNPDRRTEPNPDRRTEPNVDPRTELRADPRTAPTPGLHTESLRRRVTVAALAVLAVLVITLGLFVDLTLQRRLRSDLQAELVDATSSAGPLVGGTARELAGQVARQGWGVRVQWPDGTVVAIGPQPPTDLPALPLDSVDGMGGMMRAGHTVAVIDAGKALIAVRMLPGGGTLEVVADTGYVGRAVTETRILTAIGGAGVLALGWLLLSRTVGVALRPLDSMTALARSITAGDRGRRLDPDRTDTELGRAAGAFDEMLDELEGAELTARQAEAQARAAEARMREFLSDAAHELRTPVAGLRSVAETTLRADVPAEDRERLAVIMVQEAARAGRLVDDLLAMARIDRGLELQCRQVNLGDLVASQVDRLRLTAPNLAVHVTGTAPAVDADPERVTQVLANLLDNARRAMHGSGRVEVSLSDGPGSSAGQGWAVVDVRDDGPGIPDAELERVFDRFVRLDAARSGTLGGAGLGLPIARGIARAHGGELQAHPSARGAWFQLRLPAANRPADPSG